LIHLNVYDLIPWEVTQDRLPCDLRNSHEVFRSCHEQLDTIAIDIAQFRPQVLYDIDGLLQKKQKKKGETMMSDGTEHKFGRREEI
jgi:hypothetical protein